MAFVPLAQFRETRSGGVREVLELARMTAWDGKIKTIFACTLWKFKWVSGTVSDKAIV